jgi:cytochrome c oxidase subunit 4
MFRSSALRAIRPVPAASPAALARHVPAVAGPVRARCASHAVSNVTLADIEKRWETMPPNEQADLWMSLRDRMKGSWSELTMQEKKACALSLLSLCLS